jgi:hypothetical protein
LLDYFGGVSIVHLSERTDRHKALRRELSRIGIAIDSERVRVPEAPRPSDANGFPSRGVYGNFLSHLQILRTALRDGAGAVWVLEDDAIFRHSLHRVARQEAIVQTLQAVEWDTCFLGHALRSELDGLGHGLVPCARGFRDAHCYAIHRRALPRLVMYLEQTLLRPPGDPEGGRMYIDGAFGLFHHLHPDVVALVSNPCLSVQRGAPSSLGSGHWYDRSGLTRPLVRLARAARDELWRRRA